MAEKTPTKAELQKHLDELEERLGEAEAKRDEYLADLQRLAADFDNYRKRAARDQQSLVTRAHERLVKDLLPVLDDLERALEAAAEHEEAKLEEGVRAGRRGGAPCARGRRRPAGARSVSSNGSESLRHAGRREERLCGRDQE